MWWPEPVTRSIRRETHFGHRVVRCYANRPTNADTLLRTAAATWPGAEALVDGDRRLTYAELDSLVERFAGNLAGRGLKPQDRLALFLDNSAEFIVAMLAATRIGAVFVPISTRLQKREIRQIMSDSGARTLVAAAELAERLPDRAELPALETVISAGGAMRGTVAFCDFLVPASAPVVSVRADDPYAILYTSGTTGRPKGAVLSHLGIVHAAMQFADCWKLQAHERTILAVPATHATGIGAVIATMLHVGGCVIVCRAFRARTFLEMAAHERLTYSAMVPAMYGLLLLEKDLSRFDLGSWHIGGYGGAPMAPATIEALAKAVPHLQLVNAYGATETTAPPLLMPIGRTSQHLDSVGCVVPCAEVMIVDDTGIELPPGEAGEIWIRGPTVIPSYWNSPAADAECFADGWWKSGDIGSLDGDGYLRVLDRKKDMIIRGGYKIFSAEVEYVIADHPAVVECAVVGRPDAVLGERVHAFVVTRAPSVTADAIHGWCNERLADYKCPESLTLQSEPLPRSSTGKLLKSSLRERAASAANH